jgi:hypothetical protein
MTESAVMILHGFRARSPVVTEPGCCPSAARRSHPRDPRDHNLIRCLASCELVEQGGQLTGGFSAPLVTVGDRSCPSGPGTPRTQHGPRSRPVADAFGAPVLRDQGPIGRPGTARPMQASTPSLPFVWSLTYRGAGAGQRDPSDRE